MTSWAEPSEENFFLQSGWSRFLLFSSTDKRIEFVAHAPAGHIKLKLKPSVKVNFDHEKSFNTLLGFEHKLYTNSVSLSENRP